MYLAGESDGRQRHRHKRNNVAPAFRRMQDTGFETRHRFSITKRDIDKLPRVVTTTPTTAVEDADTG